MYIRHEEFCKNTAKTRDHHCKTELKQGKLTTALQREKFFIEKKPQYLETKSQLLESVVSQSLKWIKGTSSQAISLSSAETTDVMEQRTSLNQNFQCIRSCPSIDSVQTV